MLAGALAAAAPVLADPVAGATYHALLGDGARLTFTVTSDGTLVDTYELTGLNAGGCSFYSEEGAGGWPGAPINANSFAYTFPEAIDFRGTFDASGNAHGSIHLIGGSGAYRCDSGVVCFIAVPGNATPPPPTACGAGGSGSGGSGSGSGGTGSTGAGGSSGGGPYGPPPGSGSPGTGGQHQTRVATRVTLGRVRRGRLTGRLATLPACRSGRPVLLLQGTRRVASTSTGGDGRFSIRRAGRLHGRRLRAVTLARIAHGVICEAGSSPRVMV